MTEFVFEIENGRAIPVKETTEGCNAARFRLCDGRTGTLVIGDERFCLGAQGATVTADALRGGLHTPAFYVEGKRYEAPALITFGGTLFFLPPSRAEIYALEKKLKSAEAQLQALCRRLDALEAQLGSNHIF